MADKCKCGASSHKKCKIAKTVWNGKYWVKKCCCPRVTGKVTGK